VEEVSMAIISPYCMLQLVNSQSDSTTGTHEKVEHYTLAHIIINIHHIFNTVLELLLLTCLKFYILQV